MAARITKELLEEIVEKIADNIHPQKIILFGSYAYGHPGKNSDLDLLVIKESDLPRHKRSIEIRKLFYDYCIHMDILVNTPEEFEYWKDVKCHLLHTIDRKGKIVYEQKNTIS